MTADCVAKLLSGERSDEAIQFCSLFLIAGFDGDDANFRIAHE